MSSPSKFARALLLAGLFSFGAAAHAGKACEEVPMTVDAAKTAYENAVKLAKTLDGTEQKVLILARRGQNLDKYGVTFSHAAFALRDAEGWAVYHELNTCGTAESKLYVQGLADFLGDDLYQQEVAIVAPEPWLQERLLQVLASKEEQFRMHHAAYSAVAYPFSTKYQNSNGWLLETYARAAADLKLSSRDQAQGWLKAAGYVPSTVEMGALTRLGGRMFKANVAFDDHPGELRWSGRITVNTGDSVLRLVEKQSLKSATCDHKGFGAGVCVVRY